MSVWLLQRRHSERENGFEDTSQNDSARVDRLRRLPDYLRRQSSRPATRRCCSWCEANTPPLVGTLRWSWPIGLPGREAQRIQQTRAAFIVDRQSPGSILVLLFAGCDNAFAMNALGFPS